MRTSNTGTKRKWQTYCAIVGIYRRTRIRGQKAWQEMVTVMSTQQRRPVI